MGLIKNGELKYTEDKNKIIVKGSYIGHFGPELADNDICIVRNTVDLPKGSDGFYNVKLTNDGIELSRLVNEFVETNILNLKLFYTHFFPRDCHRLFGMADEFYGRLRL